MDKHMDSKINLSKISADKLKTIDLDMVDTALEAPDSELQRQYYFMAKCRKYVKAESERLGRPLYCCITTFGCPMVYAPRIC